MNSRVDDLHESEGGRPPLSPAQAWSRLIAGHERRLRGEPRYSGLRREDFADLTRGQQPYATILGCSDSRVPPEPIFDAGPGELLVIPVAGNLLSPEVAGSLQYAGAHLQTPLFVVLGHSDCGAVYDIASGRVRFLEQAWRPGVLPAPAVAQIPVGRWRAGCRIGPLHTCAETAE